MKTAYDIQQKMKLVKPAPVVVSETVKLKTDAIEVKVG